MFIIKFSLLLSHNFTKIRLSYYFVKSQLGEDMRSHERLLVSYFKILFFSFDVT